jgi:disulfide bond formation protein DsbB
MENAEQSVAEQSSGLNELLPYIAWVAALVGMVGSLFFSEVMELPPCVLCWYQRIAMYPLVLIIGIGIATRESRWKIYALPLAVIGLAISIYQNLLYYGIIPENLSPCMQGVSCTERQIEWLGFITIPLMGMMGFIFICACLILYRPNKKI